MRLSLLADRKCSWFMYRTFHMRSPAGKVNAGQAGMEAGGAAMTAMAVAGLGFTPVITKIVHGQYQSTR
jgi:hypothetical protein